MVDNDSKLERILVHEAGHLEPESALVAKVDIKAFKYYGATNLLGFVSHKKLDENKTAYNDVINSAVLIADACYCGTESDDILSKKKFNDIITDLSFRII